MKKIYQTLVEDFGYIVEDDAEDLAQRYGADSYVATAAADGKNDPVPNNKPDTKPAPKPGRSGNAGTRAFQHWLNSKGIKVAVDGKWGPETANGNQKYFDTYVVGRKISKEQQDEYEAMRGVGTAYNVRVSPGSGNVYIGSPEYINTMKKYGYDTKTGNPIGGVKTADPGKGPAPGGAGMPAAIPDDPKGKALAISKAISGPGTDEQAVYAVIDSIKNAKELTAVSDAYKAAWGGSRELGKELIGDFSGMELVTLNQKIQKLGMIINTAGQLVPNKTAESTELDTIRFLSGLK